MKTFALVISSILFGLLLGISAGAGSSQKTITLFSIPTDSASPDERVVVELPDHLTSRQARFLSMAHDIAAADGLPHPQLLQAILLQESNAGEQPSYKVGDSHLPTNKRSYGLGQIKLETAHAVLRRWPEMWEKFGFQTHTDEEVIAKLIEDPAFNISIASKYLLVLKSSGYSSDKALAVAYNKGPGGAQGVDVHTDLYATSVSQHIRALPTEPAAPVAAGMYHVRSGDSLSRIAMNLSPGEVQRVMDAIFAANPRAFIGGDRDLLMADVDIAIPKLA